MVLFSFMFDALKSGILLKQLKHVVRDLDMLNKNEEADQQIHSAHSILSPLQSPWDYVLSRIFPYHSNISATF